MSDSKRHRWLRYVRFWGANVDADIDDELRYHLELRISDFVKRGLSPDDARAAALEGFGNPAEIARELREHDLAQLHRERRADMFQGLMQDVRYGFRQLRSAPRFTFAAIVVLALGIGANTAIFSAIDAAFLKPLPFKAPERLIALATAPPFAGGRAIGAGEARKSEPDLLDHRADTTASRTLPHTRPADSISPAAPSRFARPSPMPPTISSRRSAARRSSAAHPSSRNMKRVDPESSSFPIRRGSACSAVIAVWSAAPSR